MTEASDASTQSLDIKRANARASRLHRAPILDEMLARLRFEAERTGIGSMRLLRGARDRPARLTTQIIDSWLSGVVRSAVPAHVEYVLNRWATFPTNRHVALTPDMSAMLTAELNRTGMGAVTILKHADNLPPGLTWQVLGGWIDHTTRTASEMHWEYIVARLRALPDRSADAPSHRVRRSARHKIDPSDLAELRSHRERTGIGGAVLLRTATGKPKALTPSMISGWLSGATQTANPEHIAYVLMRYRAWP